jgi:hypothetical protein
MNAIKYGFTLIGIGMLIGAFFFYKNTSSFLQGAAKAEGTVVELVRSRSSDSTTYAPVIQFTDQKGVAFEFTSSTSSNPPGYTEGEKVEVLYLQDRPQEAKINGFFSLWGGAVIVGGLGGVFFLIGATIILITLLRGRRDEYLKQQGTPIETEYRG